ncbi:lantibiotic dehydratase [Amycolatopsis tolypomycina]|uniref:lantibiotic dehydratase n=1 Tax=Amycolatopsis tolypomycina TaxID=208445 RepID=UPI0033A41D1A
MPGPQRTPLRSRSGPARRAGPRRRRTCPGSACAIDRLERHADLRPRLTVVVDDARFVRDRRVIVHRRPEVGASAPGPLWESSVRLTRPVRFVLAAAGFADPLRHPRRPPGRRVPLRVPRARSTRCCTG